jgi:hypothetical protein
MFLVTQFPLIQDLYDNGWEVNEIELASYGLNKLVKLLFLIW